MADGDIKPLTIEPTARTLGSPAFRLESKDSLRDISAADNLVQLLQGHSRDTPDAPLFTFLRDQEQRSFGFREIERRAAAVSTALRGICQPGDRAALLYPFGPEFVTAFLGCLGAGIIAVPLYPPSKKPRSLETTASIIRDCGAAVVLSASATIDALRERLHGVDLGNRVKWLCSDDVGAGDGFSSELPDGDTTAFLQYTSGSTGAPKGVVVSHHNLLDNIEMLALASEFSGSSVGVSWLPPYHDMGLIGGLLMPIAVGFHTALMAPTAFLQRPIRWLQAISQFGATGTGGPNFGYELCVSKIDDDEASSLSLETLEVAYNGAEPISASTIDRFTAKFAGQGFRRSAFFPCYGLAEATLFVSGTGHRREPIILDDGDAAEADLGSGEGPRAHRLASCGRTWGGTQLKIVDRGTGTEAGERQTGEIWVRGRSVASGYWRNPEATSAAFNAVLADGSTGWLRTGDLGFLLEGQLYISGREKDLVIIRGRNYYPQDIERTVEACHEAIQPNGTAAFSVHIDGEERLVVVVELSRSSLKSADPEVILASIRRAVSENHELQVYAIALLKPAALPTTTSGKVRRRQCRTDYLDGALSALTEWRLGATASTPQRPHQPGLVERNASSSLLTIRKWLVLSAAEALGVNQNDLDLRQSLRDYGLDSFQAATVSGEFSERFGFKVEPDVFDRFDDLGGVAEYLAAKYDARQLLLSMVPTERAEFIDELAAGASAEDVFHGDTIPRECYLLDELPEVQELEQRVQLLSSLRFSPYFSVHEGTDNEHTQIAGKQFINFSSNNFLSLSGHPTVTAAAVAALQTYGSSVSGSRLIAGERPLHRELEQNIAHWLGVDDAVAFVSANLANVSTVGHLYGPEDLILYDELSHNSLLQGAKLSHAEVMPFRHNDVGELRRLLKMKRRRYRKVLVFIEGLYSMDGDLPDLPAFIEAKSEYNAHLMVDECLSIGVIGATGRGIGEHFGVQSSDVDLWMGGISKAFASCGGYIAGSADIVKYLRYSSPGFIYTTGLSPANAAAALEAMRILKNDPNLLDRLRSNTQMFIKLALHAGMNLGACKGEAPIVPVIIGDQMRCLAVHQALHESGINVTPIFYPAVSENSARLRFSLSPTHEPDDIRFAIDRLHACLSIM